ncbi:hypothetical protein DEJ31_13020 [Curtobacterium sp. MCPF17_031]|nr:hypothetical protein DEJ31_13020 [Curtobacterium sp. MCPF17_031]
MGRFRSGHQLSERPATLEDWRITTGDPEVADKVYDLFGGHEPQDWQTKGEDSIEVFTAVPEVEVLIEDASKLRQRMVLWSRAGKLVIDSDGSEELVDETPAPFRGPEPLIDLTFRLAAAPEVGRFCLRSRSWNWATDLARHGTAKQLAAIPTPVRACLALEKVSFIAKNGPRAGEWVSYSKPSLALASQP